MNGEKKKILIALLLAFVVLADNSGLCKAEGKTVYGFWQYQQSMADYQPDWSCLTHIAYFACDAKSDGSISPIPNITNYYAIRDAAQERGIKVVITVKCFDQEVQDSIFANHRDDFANNVLNLVEENGADGVNIDFEIPRDTNTLTGGSNSVLFEDLMKILHGKLKSRNPDYHISFDVSGNMESMYRNENLGQYVDSVFLMGYDYHSNDSAVTGAVSPYKDPAQAYDLVRSVDVMKIYYDASQIIVGLPFYGYDWPAISDEPGASTTGSGRDIQMRDAVINAQKYGRLWDPGSGVPWYRYEAGGTWHQAWYEDGESLGMKFDYALKNTGGIGFWSLGYEGNNSEIWSVIGNSLAPQPIPSAPA